jgi:hypothetical protein
LRRSFIHFEQLKTTNGIDILTIEQNEERLRCLTNPKRSARTGHADKESPLLQRLEEMSLISPLSNGGEFPALSSTLRHEETRTRSASPSKNRVTTKYLKPKTSVFLSLSPCKKEGHVITSPGWDESDRPHASLKFIAGAKGHKERPGGLSSLFSCPWRTDT